MLHPGSHPPTTGTPIVALDNVSCGYDGQPVMTGMDLRVMPGDFVGLLGPSGSGKTTLLRVILGAVRLFCGRVLLDGVPVGPRRPPIGYVPQLETIDWNFPVTVREVVLMGAAMRKPLFPWHSSQQGRNARVIMERLGIANLAHRHIRQLSGGQQQRVFLARALISNPRLLLLDEPTAGVDIKTRDDIMHLLHELNHQGVTIVMTTHEINSVAAHLPQVVCINGGIVAQGPPTDIFTSDILSRTYGADMPVIRYQGLALVAERPHVYGPTADQHTGKEPHLPTHAPDS